MREQAVTKEWNKKGLMGLRVSSLMLLENTGGGNLAKVLIRHTLKALPQGLWDRAEQFCREICFVAQVEFTMEDYLEIIGEVETDREDEEFD